MRIALVAGAFLAGAGRGFGQEKRADARPLDSSPSARIQAVNLLGNNVWQADAQCEEALVHALRSDTSESVRIQAATILSRSKYLTPKAHNALQHCVVGSSSDGFPGERVAAVKTVAQEALKKHPTSASPAIIAQLQRTTAEVRKAPATGPARPAATLGNPLGSAASSGGINEIRHRPLRDGTEESSAPERPTLGGPLPTDVPCPCNSPSATPAAAPTATPAAAPMPMSSYLPSSRNAIDPAPKTSWLPFLNKRPAAPAPNGVTVTYTPPPAPAPTPGAVTPTTATGPDARPAASPIPITDRTPPEQKSALPSIDDIPEQNVSMKQRRNDLRDSGLRDGSLRAFTDRAGAGPPRPATTSSSGTGLLRRWFPPAPTEADPVTAGGTIAPLSPNGSLRTP